MSNEYPIWQQKMNYGGFADDKFLGIKNSFTSAKGVEIRQNPHTLKLAKGLVNDNKDQNGNTVLVEDFVGSFVTIKSSGITLACGKSGKIYKKTHGQIGWTLNYTLNTGLGAGNRIINAIEYNGFVYFLTEAKIHRIAIGDVAQATWTDFIVLNYKNFNTQTSNYRPALEINNKLYIGDGSYLGELDSLGTWTYNKLAIFGDEEIVGLTYGGAMARIFGTKLLNSYGQKTRGGHKYYWDTTSESYNELVYTSEPIHCVASNGGSDYMIAGMQPYLYLSDGYNFTKLKKLPFVGDIKNCYLGANFMDFFEKILTFAFQFPFGDSSGYEGKEGRGLMTYGKYDDKYPDALNFEFPSSQYEQYTAGSETYPAGYRVYFGAVHNANGRFYVSWAMYGNIGDAFLASGIDEISTTKYNATGELVSLVHYGQEACEDKAAKLLKIAFNKLNAGEKIEVFLSKNFESFPATPEISIDYSYTPDEGDSYPDRNIFSKSKDVALEVGDYQYLQTKVVLTAGTNQLTTPEVYELSIGFDDVELGD